MPVVPSPSVPSVAPTGNTGVSYQNANGASPDAFGAGIGQAEQGLGKAVDNFGDVLQKHAMRMQEEVNTSAAKDLFLQGDVAIGKLTIDYNSLEGANRVNAYPKYVEDIGKVREDLKRSSPNDEVAKKFDQDFARRVGYSIVDGARSAATANKQYQKETNAAVQQNAMSHIAANAKDDNRFETELGIGLETVKSSDEYKGSSPEVKAQHEQAFTTQAWSTRLQAMSKTDPLRARDLFTANKDKLDGITQLKLDDQINQQIINVQTRVDSDKIVQSGALVSPDLAERVKKLEGYAEKPYADFKQTSSGYGTKAQPGDENIPPEQRRAVYEQRLNTELGRAATIVDTFSPGLPKGTRDALISLTYNAGSSWTSSGLGNKIRSGDFEGAKQNFAQYNQAGGTVNSGLVDRRAQELSWWGGDKVESDPTNQLGTALDKAKEQALKTFPDDPANQAKYLDTLQNRIKTDFSVMQGAARNNQLAIRNTVQQELFAQDSKAVSYETLSPKAQAAYDMAPPALQHSFDQQMRKNSTADVPLTAERQSRFDTLRGESINEPDKFMSRDISNEDIPRPQKSILLKTQADKKALVDKGANLQGAMTKLQPLLNDAQIGKSATDQAKNEEYNKFSGVLQKQLDDFYQDKKRPPNDKELREMGSSLLKDVVTSPGTIWDSKDRAYRVIADKTPITLRAGDEAAHYATIPHGAMFVGPDGQQRIKP
jgi:GH24 family phage-related lysozyme (muramidase)